MRRNLPDGALTLEPASRRQSYPQARFCVVHSAGQLLQVPAMIEVRFAKPTDAATVFSFVRALAEYERMPHAVETNEETLAAQLRSSPPPFECLLAEEAATTLGSSRRGTPVGFALLFHTYSTWRGRRGIWLEDLFVLPDWRRHGVGRTLLDAVVSLAKERGCGRVEWSVLDWNQSAIDFYRAYGAEMLHEWRICRMSL